MAIFIPAGGSVMMRGGPIFWSAPLAARQHSTGDMFITGGGPLPNANENAFYSVTHGGNRDCFTLVSPVGGNFRFELTLHADIPVQVFMRENRFWYRCLINNIVVFTSPVQILSGHDLGRIQERWNFTLPLERVPMNGRILFQACSSLTLDGTRVGLRMRNRLLTNLAGTTVSLIEHTSILEMGVHTPLAQAVPPATNVNARSAPPVRTISPAGHISEHSFDVPLFM